MLSSMNMPQASIAVNVVHTPEAPTKMIGSKESDRLQRAEEQMKQAVDLSEIDESFLKVTHHTRIQEEQAVGAGDDFGSYVPLNFSKEAPQRQGASMYMQEEIQFTDATPVKKTSDEASFSQVQTTLKQASYTPDHTQTNK